MITLCSGLLSKTSDQQDTLYTMKDFLSHRVKALTLIHDLTAHLEEMRSLYIPRKLLQTLLEVLAHEWELVLALRGQ